MKLRIVFCVASMVLLTIVASHALNYSSPITSQNFSVTVGGGGPPPGGVQPYGNIPCPRGCSWVNTFNADFTTMSPSTTIYDSVNGPTNALYWVHPDGSHNYDNSGAGNMTACYGGMIDTSHLPGYLALHALGTIPWETAGGSLSCVMLAKTNNAGQTPPGCSTGQIYTPGSCVPITKPVLWEYRSQEAVNQLDQYTIMGSPSWAGVTGSVGSEPGNCLDLKYFGEARGNNSSIYAGFTNWESSCNSGFQVRDMPFYRTDDAPHVITLVMDPQSGWTSYFDGTLQTSPTYPSGVVNIHGCGPSTPCMDQYIDNWMTEVAISNWCTGCGAGGTWAIYWERGYTGQ